MGEKRDLFLGVDPGTKGSIGAVDSEGRYVDAIRFSQRTWADVFQWLEDLGARPAHAMIERVGAMPKQGVASTFTFGRAAGIIEGLIIASRIPYSFVAPAVWQRRMGCLSKGDKRVTKARAEALWPVARRRTLETAHGCLTPKYGMSMEEADGCLIAEYGRIVFAASRNET